jgi:hypothetical protein
MQHIRDYILIIGFFFLGVFAYESCHKTDKKADFSDMSNYNKIKEIHDTVYLKTYRKTYIKGDSIPFVIIATDTIATHDTAFIMYDYNVSRAYSDTIKQDSNIFVINDTISQNRIKSRSFESKITEKTIYVKEFYAEKAKYRLFYGIRGDFSQSNGLEVLSPGLMLNAKNKALIGLNLNINKNNNISYSGSLYLKIGRK